MPGVVATFNKRQQYCYNIVASVLIERTACEGTIASNVSHFHVLYDVTLNARRCPASKASKKKVDPGTDVDVDASKYNMDDVAAARELARGMVSREIELLRARLKLIAGRVHTYVEDLRSSAEIAQQQCQEWLRSRYSTQALMDH
eukprot:scaffold502717_cov39-Prasinocladus_malaysianus.AAC.1